MIGLTEKQAELLAFIKAFQKANRGISPSFEEMKEGVGLHSKSGVHRLVEALVDKGHIRRLHNRARSLEIVSERENSLAQFSTAEIINELARRAKALSVAA